MSENGIRDARKLGTPKVLLLGFQHLFAMFGATVLVPALTGLSVSATLLFAGLGTLLFHLLTKRMVPAFLGSSFAFLGGYFAIAELINTPVSGVNWIPYAGLGVMCAGLLYVAISALFKYFGAGKVMRFFPPIVTGPIIICIGITLANSAINNCVTNWWIALLAIVVVIACNIWGKGMLQIVPILMGVLVSYIVAACFGQVDFSSVSEAAWVGLPFQWKDTVFSLFGNADAGLIGSALAMMIPISLATIVEHIGDMCAISSTCERNYIEDPGFHRTLLGDGLATALASVFGAPANTTYGENTGVLALSRVYDPLVIRIAAVIAIIFSFCPKFSALISSMPTATIGGVSLVLYGMISAVGVRNIVENKVDFTNTRNVIIAALILVLAIGVSYTGNIIIPVGNASLSLSGLAVASLTGIILNAILPGKDYDFDQSHEGSTSVNFQV